MAPEISASKRLKVKVQRRRPDLTQGSLEMSVSKPVYLECFGVWGFYKDKWKSGEAGLLVWQQFFFNKIFSELVSKEYTLL